MKNQTTQINIMAQAHEIARTLGQEFGHYSVRLKLALKQVWDMIKFASKSDKSLKVNTGAVKMEFSVNKQDVIKQMNSELSIVKLNNMNFYFKDGSYIKTNDYVIKHATLGVLGFEHDRKPYMPVGGYKALESILKAGGFVNFDGIKFWKL